jgi:hypothetical protein
MFDNFEDALMIATLYYQWLPVVGLSDTVFARSTFICRMKALVG